MIKMRLIFLFFMLMNTLQASAQSDDLIFWEEGKKLTWQDFTEGIPSRGAAAQSALSIHYTVCKRSIWNGKVALRVDCTFQKSKSLVSKPDIYPMLLRHEQLHFDIAEVFARKLRKEFSNSKLHLGNVDEETKRIYFKVMLEYENFQRMFDLESRHGTEKDTQLKWERKVQEELKLLENYKDNGC